MKHMRIMLILLFLLPFIMMHVNASEAPSLEISPQEGLDDEVLDQIGPYSSIEAEGFFDRLTGLLKTTFARVDLFGIPDALKTAGVILSAVLLCGVLQTDSGLNAHASMVSCLTITAACTQNIHSMMGLGSETLSKLHNYMSLLLPGMTTLMLSSGRAAGAGAMSALAGFGFTVLQHLISGIVVPLIYVFAGLSAAEALWGKGSLVQMRDLAKWIVVCCLKGVLYGFSVCLTLTGVFSTAVDAGKLKAARFAIGAMVPLVGNLVSGVSESVLSAAELLKSSVGLYGMLAVFGFCLSPFLHLGVQYLALKLTTAVCGLFGQDGQVGLLQKLTEAVGLILAMTAVSCILSLLTLTLCIQSVQP